MIAITQSVPALAALMLLLFLSTAYGIERDPKVVSEFKRTHICPSTGTYSQKCPGFQVDHWQALECGGSDTGDNLQYLSVEAHRLKTLVDNKFCKGDRFKMR